ncbi:MAG: DUF3179 domain-containing protein [Cyanobacteria bacterium P01_G01_bin.38]
MQRVLRLTMGSLSVAGLIFGGLIWQARGWDNFKLRSFASAQVLRNQVQNAVDPRKQTPPESIDSRVDMNELLSGGVPKDGIPSIDAPEFDTAETTPFQGDDVVIGLVVNGEAKVYPFRVMDWHEIVNDTVGGMNVTVSYCPLCDTMVAFERGETTFGVSGMLYQSCLVMYDRADETLYAQPWGTAVLGPKVNEPLARIPVVKTTLENWLAQYPESKILSTRTGHNRNYQAYPYGSYYTDDNIIFPVRNQEARTLHPKAIVSYVWQENGETPQNEFAGDSHQFVHDQLRQSGTQAVEFAGRQIRARWDEDLETVVVEEMDGTVIPSSTAFAFVYPAFYGAD